MDELNANVPFYTFVVYQDGEYDVRGKLYIGKEKVSDLHCTDFKETLAGTEIHKLDLTHAPNNFLNKDWLYSRLRMHPTAIRSGGVVDNQGIVRYLKKPLSSQETQGAKPKSDVVCPGIDQVPFCLLERVGAVFADGEVKYSRGNWKQQPDNVEYDRERIRHALRHLHLYADGDRAEDHLAKVAWFCATTMWRENANNSVERADN
jgi:hypothetical protein